MSPRSGLPVLLALVLGCSDPVAPLDCTVRLDSGCWTYVGLDGQIVLTFAETPWGLYAGTQEAEYSAAMRPRDVGTTWASTSSAA